MDLGSQFHRVLPLLQRVPVCRSSVTLRLVSVLGDSAFNSQVLGIEGW